MFFAHVPAISSHNFSLDTNPEAFSALALQSYATGVTEGIPEIPYSRCLEALGTFIADVVFFAIGLVGLHFSNQERLARALFRELGEDTMRGLIRSIHNFNEVKGAWEKAKALFSIVGGIYNAGGFRAAWKVIKHDMSWWEWLKTGIIAVVQFIAWFATDGAAFIAEAALTVISAESLVEDGIKAVEACTECT